MNVGILSMQKIKNYGSFLQAFALKKTVESYGHNCEFVDIEHGEKLKEYKINILLYFKKAKERFLGKNIISRVLNHYKFQKIFNSYHEMLNVKKRNVDNFDLIIIGSDEVFNIAQYTPWGVSLQLFGNVNNTKKVISYAGSFGNTTIEIIKKYNLQEQIALSMKNLSSISVRDENSRNIVKFLMNIDPTLNIDPVLFFDFNKYIKPIHDTNYILIYSYPARMSNKNEINKIKTFAKETNKKLISIGFYFEWCDKTVIPNPFEVISYFINADYIITDTFHGCILSIKYNKQFIVFVRNSNSNKITFLLKSFKIEDRIILSMDNMNEILLKLIDYKVVNELISEEKQKSKLYFQKNL
jgi:hypothetical protein